MARRHLKLAITRLGVKWTRERQLLAFPQNNLSCCKHAQRHDVPTNRVPMCVRETHVQVLLERARACALWVCKGSAHKRDNLVAALKLLNL